MEYRRLGRSGLKVSEICLGTMTFGHGADQAETDRIVGRALDGGVNFFDTANGYNGGQSEIMLGKALKGRRDKAVIATKFFNPMGPGPNDSGMSRRHIMTAVEDSLRRLGTDRVELCFIHHVDHETPLEEALGALDDLIRQGKVAYPAISNYECWRLMAAVAIGKQRRHTPFAAYQPQYSLVVRDIEQELVPACTLEGIGIVAWSPLAGGFLTGKYKKAGERIEGSRSAESWAFPERFFAPNADATLGTLLDTAKTLGRSAAQVALRWALDQSFMTSVIIGARNVAQLDDNLGAAGWRLPEDAFKLLGEVSFLPHRYPRTMEDGMRERRAAAVKVGR